ncbi:MAG: hypothetical protein J6P78_06045 [Lachnospiraceae bacterium]|nr:hypothetical protein [Lachnospiraceae bacterium]
MTDEQKRNLYYRQKETLDQFLTTGAITRAQYEKSLGDLTRKMGMEDELHKEEAKDEQVQ